MIDRGIREICRNVPSTDFPDRSQGSQIIYVTRGFIFIFFLTIIFWFRRRRATQRGTCIDRAFNFSVLLLSTPQQFGRMPKPSSLNSRWSTYLYDANVHTWLDFVISVIVLISQSQLASRRKQTENGQRVGGWRCWQGGGGCTSLLLIKLFFFCFICFYLAALFSDELQKMCPTQTWVIQGWFVMRPFIFWQCFIVHAVTHASDI